MKYDRDESLKRNLAKAKLETKAIQEKYAWVKPHAKELREVFGGFESVKIIDDGVVIGKWRGK